jgi:hypothetical protein
MKVICAWCKKIIREGNSDEGLVSHGICDICLENFDHNEHTGGEHGMERTAERNI